MPVRARARPRCGAGAGDLLGAVVLSLVAIDVPGATRTAAAGINAAGDVVGGWSDATTSHGFLLQAGVFTPIDFPLAPTTTAFGISDTGEIAGSYDDTAGTTHGFIYAGGPPAPWTSPAPAAPY